jgi:hypothetical protein
LFAAASFCASRSQGARTKRLTPAAGGRGIARCRWLNADAFPGDRPSRPDTSLREVRLCNIDDETCDLLVSEMRRL